MSQSPLLGRIPQLGQTVPSSGVVIIDEGDNFEGDTLEEILQELITLIGDAADHSLETVAASGTAVTVDLGIATTWDITLTANCTITLTGGVAGEAWVGTIILRQGGSGSYTVTWDPDIDWLDTGDGGNDGSPPTLYTAVGSQTVVDVATLDAGTSWGGDYDSTTAPVTTLDGLTDVVITSPATADRLRYDGSVWRNTTLGWQVMVDGSGLVMLDGNLNPMEHEVAH